MMSLLTPAFSFPLSQLLAGIVSVPNGKECVIRGLTLDSRHVCEGDLFIAIPGTVSDGRHHVQNAVKHGAAAVVYEEGDGFHFDGFPVPVIPIEGLRHSAGLIADKFYKSPSKHLTIIGVTGTNGKTTCVQLLAQALNTASSRCGLIGTLGHGFPGELSQTNHTTPDVLSVHRILADFRDAGATHVCMEVSSHALDQGRVSGVRFDVAVFTNLSRDHLDYHGDMENYASTKAGLFSIEGLSMAVINADDSFGRELLHRLQAASSRDLNTISYGIHRGDIRAEKIQPVNSGLELDVVTPDGDVSVSSRLFGRFNASNLLAVLATLLASEYDLVRAAEILGRLQPVIGRVESFGGQGKIPRVFVDYAHTPDALEKVLSALREHTRGKLWCVFGCGGDRDRGKRPLMGQAAETLADVVILTDDNPRHETPDHIIEDIISGMTYRPEVIRPRREAICTAVHRAGNEDVVLIAGKGHEDYQEVGDQRVFYSDRIVVQELLEEAA